LYLADVLTGVRDAASGEPIDARLPDPLAST
jgi:hypothetical protein